MLDDMWSVGETMRGAWAVAPWEDVDAGKRHATQALAHYALEQGVLLGKMELEVVQPDDARIVNFAVSEQWPKGTVVAIASAVVTSVLLSERQRAGAQFLGALTLRELELLRKHTRDVGAVYGHTDMTDGECDRIIGECGPRAAEAELRRIIDAG